MKRRARAAGAVAIAVLVAAVVVAWASPARAQANYSSTPLGGRSALMGNTGVALAKDGSAPFLNPATIVRIDDAKFAFSVNMYSASVSNYTNWHAPAGADTKKFGSIANDDASETQSRLDVLPSTLCFFFTLKGFGKTLGDDQAHEDEGGSVKGRQKLAICLGAIDRSNVGYSALNFHTAGNAITQAASYSRNWSRFAVGPTFSTYVTDDIAVGLSLHGVYANYDENWSSSTVGSDANMRATSSSFNASANAHSLDLAAILGVSWRASRWTTLGASLQTQAGSIFGSYTANEFSGYAADQTHSQVTLAKGDFAAPAPFRLSLGVGTEWSRMHAEANVSLYAPLSNALSSEVHVDQSTVDNGAVKTASHDFAAREYQNAVINSAMGFEYAVTPEIAALGGLGTDFSASGRLTPQSLPTVGLFTADRINRGMVSMGIGSHGKSTEIIFGTQLAVGWGHAYAVNSLVLPSSIAVIDVKTYSAIFIIAGSADLHALGEAVKGVEHIVVPKTKEKEPQK